MGQAKQLLWMHYNYVSSVLQPNVLGVTAIIIMSSLLEEFPDIHRTDKLLSPLFFVVRQIV